jgi:hypothetical protein
MVPLYNARIRDLGPDDCVRIVCFACKDEMLVSMVALLRWPHVSPETPILDLERRVRCRACGARGEALVSVVWAGN